MLQLLRTLLRKATRRRYRLRVGLTVACWILLNMQLVTGSHHSSPPPASEGKRHYAARMNHSLTQSCVENTSQKLLCEKHCHPDRVQPSSTTPLHPDAVALETLLLIPVRKPEQYSTLTAWQTPPVTGPPTEIRFCRFRE